MNTPKPEAVLLASKLAAAFPGRAISDMTVALWAETLMSVPPEAATAAVAKAADNLDYPPTKHELRTLCRNEATAPVAITAGPETPAEKAARHKAIALMRSLGESVAKEPV